jgi:arylsulfatase A-like enzyme
VLTADHGEEFREHGHFQHGQLYEEQLRIPLVIRHPSAARGVRSPVRARSIDLMPTLLAATGHPVEDLPLDGVDLANRSAAEPSPVVSVITTGKRMISLVAGHEKLIVDCAPESGPVEVELYDLDSDPREQVDLSLRRPERVRALFADLREHLGGSPCRLADRMGGAWQDQDDLDLERLEALRALGYVR